MKRAHLSRFAGILAAALLFTGCGKKVETAPPGPPVVLVTTATQDDVPIFSEAIATLEGSTNSQIYPQVSGYILSKNYTEGAQVLEGDLLFQIDPKPFQANLDKATASLQNNQAQLKRTQQDLARYETLVKSGAVSQQEYQNEVQTVQSAQANVDAAQASVTSAQIELNYTKVTAPITGIAGKAVAQVGDLVSPTTQLTTISALNPIEAAFTVPEQFYLNNADKLAKIMEVPQADRPANMELIFADGTTYSHKGQFEYVNRQIQTSTGAINVYALFPNPENILRPGMYAKVRAVTERISNAVLIPQRAVNELQGINQVIVIKPGNVVDIRNVELGQKVGTNWIVTSGIQPGETVVVEGIQKCQPGATVTPEPFVPETPPASDASAAPAGT
jgi:membrane fusion protein (multidrug efflux system)